MNRDNPLLEPVAVQAEAIVLTDAGTGRQALAFTIAHPAGETTVFLSRDQAVIWRDMLDLKISKMTSLITPGMAQAPVPPWSPNGGHPR